MFKVSFQKEIEDARKLADMIRQDNWVDSETIIVNCSPDYSSIMCQILNHELSKSNRHELLEQLPLEMPYPNMSQVWNRDTAEYEHFATTLTIGLRTMFTILASICFWTQVLYAERTLLRLNLT